MHKISVLIPTYQPKWYFECCLNSIENQTLGKDIFKVYIALNGEKEDYEDYIFNILKQYNFSFEYVYLEQTGVSNARNHLIENSIEPFITFIDDDDQISPIYLESLLKVSSEKTIGISNVYNFEQDISEKKTNYIGQSFLKLNPVEKSKFKSRKYFSSPWAKLIHRDIIGSTRFKINLAIGEDSLFMAELSNKVKSVKKTSPEAIYYVYEREGSASRSNFNTAEELKRIIYLITIYSSLLFKGYNVPFILTRIAATVIHLKRLYERG